MIRTFEGTELDVIPRGGFSELHVSGPHGQDRYRIGEAESAELADELSGRTGWSDVEHGEDVEAQVRIERTANWNEFDTMIERLADITREASVTGQTISLGEVLSWMDGVRSRIRQVRRG